MDSMKAICDDVIFETSLEQGNDDLLADLFAKTGGKEFYFKMGVMKGVTAFPRKFGLVSDGPWVRGNVILVPCGAFRLVQRRGDGRFYYHVEKETPKVKEPVHLDLDVEIALWEAEKAKSDLRLAKLREVQEIDRTIEKMNQKRSSLLAALV